MSAGGADAAYAVFEAVCMSGAAAMLCLAGFNVWRLIKLRRKHRSACKPGGWL